MFRFNEDIAMADDILYAKPLDPELSNEEQNRYTFKQYVYPDVCIPNRSLAFSLWSKSEDSVEIVALKKSIEEYNSYVQTLESIEGFREFFISNHFCVSKEEVAQKWTEEIASVVFSKKSYVFITALAIKEDSLYDTQFCISYSLSVEGTKLLMPIGEPAWEYTSSVGKRTAVWNWVDTGNDFTFAIWELLGVDEQKEGTEDDEEAVRYPFGCYDQWRYDVVCPQLVRIFRKIESLGYIQTYTVYPELPDVRWKQYGKSNGSIDLALVDLTFKKNKLLMNQIDLLLWSKQEEVETKPYILTGRNKEQYLSEKPGTFGGHMKLKIYGRLDCPSAIRFIKKGQYVKNRVFFIDEETAKKAGFRPCATCMPEEYKRWKEAQKSED